MMRSTLLSFFIVRGYQHTGARHFRLQAHGPWAMLRRLCSSEVTELHAHPLQHVLRDALHVSSGDCFHRRPL
ncbi:MAG: hypothetical protein JWL63_1554 [Rhodocyclales bacterium]|nr:hypothetical protein [Rhodocyclales bacterium]